MPLPYDFKTPLNYVSYAEMLTRIRNFDYSIIGKDASGNYNMYNVELGDRSNPTIYIVASLHGAEWHGSIFALRLMEELRDRTFADRQFAEHLLSSFHLVLVPIGNPWGYARKARRNFNNVDLNRDFYNHSQPETQAIVQNSKELEPFACLDLHLMQPSFNTHDLIYGVGSNSHWLILQKMANDLELYMGDPCRRWRPSSSSNSGLLRSFWARLNNPHTNDTISFISEITREKDGDYHYTNSEIMKAGMAQIYIFLKRVTRYFEQRLM